MDDLEFIIIRNPLLNARKKVKLLEEIKNKPQEYLKKLTDKLLESERSFFAKIKFDKKENAEFSRKLKSVFKKKVKSFIALSKTKNLNKLEIKI